MERGRWALVEEVFHAASELPAELRAAYLDRACAGDEELRAEIGALLDAVDDTGGRNTLLRQAVSAEAADVVTAGAEGRAIGPYRVIRRLGQGGMGAVYLAHRADDQYQKQVAIKLIRAGFEQRAGLLRRFLNERQILANLEHPNIARLLDGGITDEGQPYLVMELIDGVPLDEFAAARGLDAEARIRLVLGVCEAVRHAHRNMIIHRDLKPSNILVDAEGRVHLLDFGIARISGPGEAGGGATVTAAAERMLTPDYASPEMIRGERITAAADIYALGVVLYELLTLRRPFQAKTASMFEMERAIMTTDPPRPSTVPGSVIAQLNRGRQQDLEAVIGKAMRKEPGERYESADALAADLTRYLNAFPVEARQGNRRYHALKFFERHRAGVLAAAVFLATVTGLAIGMAALARTAARERDAARLERTRAEQVSSFLSSLLAGADPRQARGKALTARDLLDRGADRIGKELGDQPEVRSKLLATMGEAYQHLGLLEQSESLFEQRLALERGVNGPRSAPAMDVLRQVADIQRMRGNYEQARTNLRQALEVQRALHGPDYFQMSHSLNNLALVEQTLGNIPEAVALFREAVRVASLRRGDVETLTMRGNLATALQESGALAQAEQEMRYVLRERTARLGADHPQRARSMVRLGRILFRNGAYAEARALVSEAAPLCARVWGPRHMDTLTARILLAELAAVHGEDSRREFEEVIAVAGETIGADHPDTHAWIAAMLSYRKKPGAADWAACQRALQVMAGRSTGLLARARAAESCAVVALGTGRAGDALGLVEQAEAIRRKAQSAGHPDVVRLVALRAEIEAARGTLDVALKLAAQAVQAERALFSRPHLHLAAHLDLLGRLMDRAGKTGGAGFAAEAAEIRRRAIGGG
ncbi:MAG: tetratricopeptide repeat protein [Acidobacteria bacterium]|nr:tetratricopeptide repeat protein [Acidobacteriota bacterium]